MNGVGKIWIVFLKCGVKIGEIWAWVRDEKLYGLARKDIVSKVFNSARIAFTKGGIVMGNVVIFTSRPSLGTPEICVSRGFMIKKKFICLIPYKGISCAVFCGEGDIFKCKIEELGEICSNTCDDAVIVCQCFIEWACFISMNFASSQAEFYSMDGRKTVPSERNSDGWHTLLRGQSMLKVNPHNLRDNDINNIYNGI
jgi:hypothetical protein